MKAIVLICSCYIFIQLSKSEESFCVLNGKKSLNYVSDKFISFAVDPTVLFTDLNISETAHELGKYLAPAYVRIAGPSTKYLKFSENEDDYQVEITKKSNTLVYTPSFMDDLNEWFLNTNLSMIFAVNEEDKVEEKWNSKSVVPLLELSAQINSNCLWQLGYDTTNTTFIEYREKLKSFKNVLDTFSHKENDWGIISNELNEWSHTNIDIRKNMGSLQNITRAVLWKSMTTENDFLIKDEMTKLLLTPTKPTIKVWMVLPKSENPITFASTLILAKQIGDAALLGYEVIFKQPRLYELIVDTPNYWYILFHKTLMGRNVLDIKTNGIHKVDVHIYAHCTKNQNSFSRRGAVTFCIINSDTNEHTTSVKLPTNTLNAKHIEVQSYILTSDNENSTFLYSNNIKLTMNLLRRNEVFTPKVRRARIAKHLILTVPQKSIGFFTVPDARIPICINDEDETNLIIEEIAEVQKSDILPRISEIQSRNKEIKASTLKDLYEEMKEELELDVKFYRSSIDVKLENNTTALNNIKEQETTLKEMRTDNFADVTSQEIEEVVLQITKTLKETNGKIKREARGTGRRRPNKRLFVQTIRPQNKAVYKKGGKNQSKRNINMKLLEEKISKEESLNSKLEKWRQSSLRKKELHNGNDNLPKKTKRLQETLEELLKRKPLDLSKIFHFGNSAKLTEGEDINEYEKENLKLSKPKDSLEYLEEQQYDYLEDHSFHDDSVNYPDFHKEFGKNINILNRLYTEENGTKERSGIDVMPLLDEGYIMNNQGDDLIKKTIKRLEDYFNRNDQISDEEDRLQQNQQTTEDLDLSESIVENDGDEGEEEVETPKARTKRQQKHFTEEDIIHYRQLMNSNIRHMRDHIRKNKLKLKTTKKEQVNLAERINKLREAVEMVQKPVNNEQSILPVDTITKPPAKKSKFSLDKIKIPTNNNLKLNNVKVLKSRLAQHKLNQNNNDDMVGSQIENKNKQIMDEKQDIDAETKQLIRMIKNELRNRKPRNSNSFHAEYVPNVKLGENKRKVYVPKFSSANTQLRNPYRFKRYITKDKYNKYENTINSINDIKKDGEYFIPKIASSSDFTLVLPTKDEISLKNSEDGSELSLKHVVPKQEMEESLITTTQDINQYVDNNKLDEINSTTLYKNKNSSKIISGNTQKSRNILDGQSIFDKLFDKIFRFIFSVKDKMKTYLQYLDD